MSFTVRRKSDTTKKLSLVVAVYKKFFLDTNNESSLSKKTQNITIKATKGAKNYRKITEFPLLPSDMPNKPLNMTNRPGLKLNNFTEF